jgi:hypothetical protein
MSTEIVWLRDRHGLRFSDIDYDIVGKDIPGEAPNIHSVEQLCDFDQARRNALEAAVREKLAPRFFKRVMKRLGL